MGCWGRDFFKNMTKNTDLCYFGKNRNIFHPFKDGALNPGEYCNKKYASLGVNQYNETCTALGRCMLSHCTLHVFMQAEVLPNIRLVQFPHSPFFANKDAFKTMIGNLVIEKMKSCSTGKHIVRAVSSSIHCF